MISKRGSAIFAAAIAVVGGGYGTIVTIMLADARAARDQLESRVRDHESRFDELLASERSELTQQRRSAEAARAAAAAHRDAAASDRKAAADERRLAEGMQAMLDGELQEHLHGLNRIEPGLNRVTRSQVSAFEVRQAGSSGLDVTVVFEPKTTGVRPDFTLYLFDRFGFVTARLSDSWMIDIVQAGERRLIERKVVQRWDKPIYWRIEETDDPTLIRGMRTP